MTDTLQDLPTERALVGTALLEPRVTGECHLDPAAFSHPVHEQIWRAITAAPAGASPIVIATGLREAGHDDAANLCPTLITESDVASNCPFLASRIMDLAQRRRVQQLAARMTHEAASSPAADVVGMAERELSTIIRDDDPAKKPANLDDVLALQVPADEWVIPDILARGERLVLTGTEGGGKSVLMRQLGVCAAAGVDPFQPSRQVEPARVLLVDAENRLRTLQPWLRSLSAKCRALGRPVQPGQFFLQREEAGLDLAGDADTLRVARWVRDLRPDILMIGPAYKLFLGSASDREEQLVGRLLRNLDRICSEVGCALIVEHHAPHAAPGVKVRDMRPIGSSAWMRWPEFGIGLRPAEGHYGARCVEVTHWRGPRDVRKWPAALESGGELPWSETVISA